MCEIVDISHAYEVNIANSYLQKLRKSCVEG